MLDGYYNSLQIGQVCDAFAPNVYNLSTPSTKIFPGKTSFITLSGSEVGVQYGLRCSDESAFSCTLDGTGGSLIFEIPVTRASSYLIYALKNEYELEMSNRVTFSYYDFLTARLNDKYQSFNEFLSPEGGRFIIRYNFISLIPDNYDSGSLPEMLEDMNNNGASFHSSWFPGIILERYSIDEIMVSYGPTVDELYLGTNKLFLSMRELFIINFIRQEVGKISSYPLTGPIYTSGSLTKYAIKLESSQHVVDYILYKNEIPIDTLTGNGTELLFQDLEGDGVYTVKATYLGHVVDMWNPVAVYSGVDTRGYIKEITYINLDFPVSNYTYFDSHGNKIQERSVGASTNGGDIIQHIGYDNAGRADKKYLPYSKSGNKGFRARAESEHDEYYRAKFGENHYGYTQVVYDNSPQNHVIKQTLPGESWNINSNRTVRTITRKNGNADGVKKYVFNGNDASVNYDSDHAAGSLLVKETTDPENNITREYYDSGDKLVAKKMLSSSGVSNSIYYVYDNLGLQRYIIPAIQDEAFSPNSRVKTLSELKKYCYYTEYDTFCRVYKQHVPGAGYMINLYDKRGRLVLSQNEKLRPDNQWSFSKYDDNDRVVITGICTGTESAHKTALENQTIFGEVGGSAIHGYTNQTYPMTSTEILSVSYYDDYTWTGQSTVAFSSVDAIGTIQNSRICTKPTGIKVKVLGETPEKWLTSAIYYDKDYNVIQKVSQLYPNGLEIVSSKYDFAGHVVQNKVKQTVGSVIAEYNQYMTYDNFGRVLHVKQQITGDAANGLLTVASYEYDDLGRVSKKNIHNGKDVTTYSYDVSGKLVGASSPLFSYELGFDKTDPAMTGVSPRYDGNISYVKWKNSNNVYKAYSYEYDHTKQLSAANYFQKNGSSWSTSNKYAEKGIQYDKNGNILALTRYGASETPWHQITYNYGSNGNTIKNITINGTQTSDYVYDASGNLTQDPYRGIRIEYNILNLPQKISRIDAESENISYIYTSAGEKLATKVGSSLTYYRGPFVYSGNALEYIRHPEGFARKPTGNYTYYYTKADHTGSTRLLCHASGDEMVVDQTTEYYPYGLSFQNENLNLNRHLYSGKELQDQTINGRMLGLYDFGSRNYDPILGRWFNIDPALQMINPYLYCANSPMMFKDPNGESIEWIIIGAAAIIGAYIGGSAANDSWNPTKWDWGSGDTWTGIFGGAIIGGVTGYTGFVCVTYGLSFASAGTSFMGNVARGAALLYQGAKAASTVTSFVVDGKNAADILMGKYKFNESKTFMGQLWQSVSRATWELPQTELGYTYSQTRNAVGRVTNVEFFQGAVLVNRNTGPRDNQYGMTLGNFINGKNLKANIEDQMFMHEYGHTMQGMVFGPIYLFAVGIPSLYSATFTPEKHNGRWYERQANRKAAGYFSKKFGVDWEALDKRGKYPF